VHTLFNQLEEKVKDKRFFPKLIEKYFLKNPHFVRIQLQPSPTLAAKENLEEQQKLASLMLSLTKSDVQRILSEAQELAASQESTKEETIKLLPKVKLSDVEREGKEFVLSHESFGKFELYTHACFTNGLTYVDLIFDLPFFKEKDLPYLRLFSLLLPQLGCG